MVSIVDGMLVAIHFTGEPMDKEFEKWWAAVEQSAPWMRLRGLDYAIKAIAWSAWKASRGLI
jgi:hypothetical protein